MIIHVDNGGQPCQKVSFSELLPHSTVENRGLQDSPESAAPQPASPQQQRQYAKARRAAKKAQRERADRMPPKAEAPAPDIPESLINLLTAIAGRKAVQEALRTVATKREIFLKATEGTNAVKSFDGRRMVVDTGLLDSDQLELLRSYGGLNL